MGISRNDSELLWSLNQRLFLPVLLLLFVLHRDFSTQKKRNTLNFPSSTRHTSDSARLRIRRQRSQIFSTSRTSSYSHLFFTLKFFFFHSPQEVCLWLGGTHIGVIEFLFLSFFLSCRTHHLASFLCLSRL